MTEPKKTKKQSPPSSPDLASVLAQRGISLGAGYVDTEDPLVWDGSAKRRRSQVMADLYRMSDPDLRRFQEKAFQAGLYGTKDRKEVRFGDLDPATEQVWKTLTQRAAGYTTVGRNISPLDALDLSVKAYQGSVAAAPEVPKKINPLDVRGIAKATFQKSLGYIPDDSVLNDFAAQFEAAVGGSDGVSAAGGAGQAELADTLARNSDPVRYDARKAVGAFDTIAKMFKENPNG